MTNEGSVSQSIDATLAMTSTKLTVGSIIFLGNTITTTGILTTSTVRQSEVCHSSSYMERKGRMLLYKNRNEQLQRFSCWFRLYIAEPQRLPVGLQFYRYYWIILCENPLRFRCGNPIALTLQRFKSAPHFCFEFGFVFGTRRRDSWTRNLMANYKFGDDSLIQSGRPLLRWLWRESKTYDRTVKISKRVTKCCFVQYGRRFCFRLGRITATQARL